MKLKLLCEGQSPNLEILVSNDKFIKWKHDTRVEAAKHIMSSGLHTDGFISSTALAMSRDKEEVIRHYSTPHYNLPASVIIAYPRKELAQDIKNGLDYQWFLTNSKWGEIDRKTETNQGGYGPKRGEGGGEVINVPPRFIMGFFNREDNNKFTPNPLFNPTAGKETKQEDERGFDARSWPQRRRPNDIQRTDNAQILQPPPPNLFSNNVGSGDDIW